MSTVITSESEVIKHPEESILYAMLFNSLRDSETISSVTDVIDENVTGQLTISDIAVVLSEITVDDIVIPVSKGIVFRVAGGVKNQDYTIKATVVTSLSNTRVGLGSLQVRSC